MIIRKFDICKGFVRYKNGIVLYLIQLFKLLCGDTPKSRYLRLYILGLVYHARYTNLFPAYAALFSPLSPLMGLTGHDKPILAVIALIGHGKESFIGFDDTLQGKFIVKNFFKTADNLMPPIKRGLIIYADKFSGFAYR